MICQNAENEVLKIFTKGIFCYDFTICFKPRSCSPDNEDIADRNNNLYGFAEDKLQEAEDYARIFSDKPIAWTNLAGLYYERKELNKALDAYKEALKLDAYDSNTYAAMAQCYYRSAKYDVAYKYYDYAYQYSNDYQTKMQFRYMLGVCDIALGDFDEAYEFLKEVNTY